MEDNNLDRKIACFRDECLKSNKEELEKLKTDEDFCKKVSFLNRNFSTSNLYGMAIMFFEGDEPSLPEEERNSNRKIGLACLVAIKDYKKKQELELVNDGELER